MDQPGIGKGRLQLALVAALGIAGSAVLFGFMRQTEFLRTEAQFHQVADQQTQAVRTEIEVAVEIVRQLDGQFEAAGDHIVSRKAFSVLVKHALANHRYIQALAWIPRVDRGRRSEFERRGRADGMRSYRFTEIEAGGGLRPAGTRAVYFPVFYAEPLAGNERALGYDLASNPVRLAALNEARDNDRIAATARVTLVQEDGNQHGTLVFSPVYHGPANTLAARRKALAGFALGVLRLRDLISQADSQAQRGKAPPLVNIQVFDMNAPAAEAQLYPEATAASLEELRGGLHAEQSIQLGGRTWILLATPAQHAADVGSHTGSFAILLCGLLLTGVLVLYVEQRIRQSVEMSRYTGELETSKRQIEERSKELTEQNRLAALVAEIGIALTKGDQLQTTLQRCAEVIVQHLDAAFARIWTLAEEENVLELQASAGIYTHIDGGHARVPVGSFKIGRIAERRLPLLTNTVIGDPEISDQDWARREGMVAFAGYPLIVEDRLVGVVGLFAHKALAEKTIRSLAAVADEIALGIDRKRHEQALASSEKRFRIAAENGSDVVVELDLVTMQSRVSGRKERMLETAEDFPLCFEDFRRMLHADDHDRVTAAIRRHLETNEPYREEFRVVDRNGNIRHWSARCSAVRDATGKAQQLIVVTSDITQRKETEAALSHLAAIVESSAASIISARLDGTVLTWNAGAERIYGYLAREVVGRNLSLLCPTDHREEETGILAKVAKGETVDHLEAVRMRKDGTMINMLLTISPFHDASGKIAGASRIGWDITERKLLERQLLQAQKLEAIGQLAAGIAHEINTPIQYVGDNLRFLREAFEGRSALLARYENVRRAAHAGEDPAMPLAALAQAVEAADLEYLNEEIPKAMAQSLDGVERVATIVRAMKEFAHPGRKERRPADLNQALRNTLIVARNEFKYVADVDTDFGEMPPVACHIAELNQAFLNILVNAAHAIGQVVKNTEKRGKITVRTRQVDDSVVVAISDTGCGIPADIQARVFDPFFTTKPVGVGTGQGLAIARSIVVEKHGGSLTFEPNGAQGTTFLVALPLQTA